MKFIKDDGGRFLAGFKGTTGDCGSSEQVSKRRRGKSSARTGVYKPTIRRVLETLGYKWTPTMGIGTGCQVHCRAEELPTTGRYILSLSKHLCALVDGTIRDLTDPSRDGTRCVYGYWTATS